MSDNPFKVALDAFEKLSTFEKDTFLTAATKMRKMPVEMGNYFNLGQHYKDKLFCYAFLVNSQFIYYVKKEGVYNSDLILKEFPTTRVKKVGKRYTTEFTYVSFYY